jgi:hypothetical protein
MLGEIGLVTTDEVLAELLTGLASNGPYWRAAGAQAVRRIQADPSVVVFLQSRSSFLA